MKYTVENIYNEVYRQMCHYYEEGSNRIIEMVIDDFNDWICADFDLVKLALQATYDFSNKYDIEIPTTTYNQMKDYNINFK